MKKSLVLSAVTLVISTAFLTSCGSSGGANKASSANQVTQSDSAASAAPSPEVTLTRAEEVKISLDVACDYVRKGFSYQNGKSSDAEVDFSVAADTFREVILDYQIAQQFMDGAIAASREAHRWVNGNTLIQGAREQSYISKKDGEAIISIYNYCVATDSSATD